MKSARLTVPQGQQDKIRVQIVLDISLSECLEIERDIKRYGEAGWELQSLGRELRDLRVKAEETIFGLKFGPERIDEGNTE